MQRYRKMYTTLFNAMTDANESLKRQNYADAMEILIQAQQTAEEIYVNEEESECNNRIISIDTYI